MAEDVARPLCKCHGEPMVKNGIYRSFHGKPVTPYQDWRCAIERRERAARFYDSLRGPKWSYRILQMRRQTALYKRRQRAA
jgi:hypothetical protein